MKLMKYLHVCQADKWLFWKICLVYLKVPDLFIEDIRS